LTSVRFYWADGPLAVTYGWPRFRSEFSEVGITVAPLVPQFLFLGSVRVEARWDEITRIERTRRGIRLVFKDDRKPVVVATLRHRRLIKVVQTLCPVEFDPTLRRSYWWNV
jgi:hypothetical protein